MPTTDPSTDPNWDRVHELFADALELPPAGRPAFLDQACAGDARLRTEVDALLAAHERAGTFLSHSALEGVEGSLGAPALEGEEIGPWRVVRLLGRGGMGAVFLAERADGQYERQVALKVVKRGMDTDDILARFLKERQILARLEHPGIAHFLDAGATPDGRPYFVMERVDGLPLTRYCEAQHLTLEARLRLFCDVCSAVQYAHNNLVVHRDLKPSNVLVTADGQVKLLDFGIAKLLEGDGASGAATQLTVEGSRPLTPEYAAPEQLRGEPVTTATDVYSLGAVLYELVTGRTPYRLERRTADEALRAITTGEPAPPSRAMEELAAGEAGNGRPRLPRRLRGDLDTIVLTALRAEPGRRYGTAAALLDDLRRFLSGHPISARPDTPGYRLSKFVQRHRLGVGVAAVMLLTLAASGAAVLVQQAETVKERDRAQLEATKANQIAAFLTGIFEGADPDVARGDDVRARQLLDAGADRLEVELADQPELRAELTDLLASLYYRIGDDNRARALHRQALELRESLYGAHSVQVVEALVRLADPYIRSGQYTTADSLLARALEITESLPSHNDADLSFVLEAIGSLNYLQWRLDVADSLFRVVAGMRHARGDSLTEPMASAYANISRVARARSDHETAERYAREALAIATAIHGDEHRLTARRLAVLAATLNDAGKLEEAESVYRSTVEIQDRLFRGAHPELATNLNLFGRLLHSQGKYDEADAIYHRSLAARRDLLGTDDARIATTLTNLGGLYHQTGRLEEALARHEEALAMRRRLRGPDDPDVATALNNRAVVLIAMERYPEAADDLREAIRVYQSRLGPRHRLVSFALVNLASVHREMGQLAVADSLYREAQAVRDESLPPEHPDRAVPMIGRAEVFLRAGRPAGAEPLLREALRLREAGLRPDHWQIAQARSLLGETLSRLGRLAEAEPLLVAGHDGIVAGLGPESSHAADASRRLEEHRRRR